MRSHYKINNIFFLQKWYEMDILLLPPPLTCKVSFLGEVDIVAEEIHSNTMRLTDIIGHHLERERGRERGREGKGGRERRKKEEEGGRRGGRGRDHECTCIYT